MFAEPLPGYLRPQGGAKGVSNLRVAKERCLHTVAPFVFCQF